MAEPETTSQEPKPAQPEPRPVQREPQPTHEGELHPDAIEVETRAPPPLARVTLYVLLAFIVIAILWATLSKVDVVVTAQGRLITTAQSIVVQALETSVVRSVDVKVG